MIVVVLIIVGITSSILVVNQKKETQDIPLLQDKINIDSMHQLMSTDEFVTNQLKTYLKNAKDPISSMLSFENQKINTLQLADIYDSFTYSPHPEDEIEGVPDENGKLRYTYNAENPTKFSFWAKNERSAAIPILFIADGDYENHSISYQAIAKHNKKELDFWEQFSEKPVYDKKSNTSQWLAVFKLPIDQYPTEKMEMDVTVSMDGTEFK